MISQLLKYKKNKQGQSKLKKFTSQLLLLICMSKFITYNKRLFHANEKLKVHKTAVEPKSGKLLSFTNQYQKVGNKGKNETDNKSKKFDCMKSCNQNAESK